MATVLNTEKQLKALSEVTRSSANIEPIERRKEDRRTDAPLLRVIFVQVEPSNGDVARSYVESLFDGRVECLVVSNMYEMKVESLAEWDAVLLDVGHDDDRGRFLRETRIMFPDVPVIDMTSAWPSETPSLLRTGRCINRISVAPSLVLQSLGPLLENRRLKEEILDLKRQLSERARVDAVTGLWNSDYIRERMGELFHDWKRYHLPATLCVVDIPEVRNISQERGEKASEGVEAEMARLIRENKRDTDMAGRLGIGEFCVIFPNTTLDSAMVGVDRYRRAFRSRVYPVSRTKNLILEGTFATLGFEEKFKAPEELIEAAKRILRRKLSEAQQRTEVEWSRMAPVQRSTPSMN